MINQQRDILRQFLSGNLDRASQLDAIWPQQPDASHYLVACAPHDYSASAFAKAVEDCDAQLLGLSVTGMRDSAGRPVVAITASCSSTEGVTRSLARYGYEVIYARGADGSPEQDRYMERLGELMHYLEM